MEKAMKLVFAILLIVVPIVFVPQIFLMFDAPKLSLIVGLVSLLFLLTFFKGLDNKVFVFSKIIKSFWVFLFLYIASFLISTALSVSYNLSFYGSYWRHAGLLQFVFFVLLFFVTLIFVSGDKRDKNLNFLVNSLCVGGLLVALYSIYQGLIWTGLRVYGTVGQTNALATYLLMVLPFVVYRFFKENDRNKNIFFAVSFLSIVIALFLTLSREMMFGLLVMILLFSVCRRKWLIVGAISLFFVFVCGVNIFANYSFVNNNVFLSRLIFSGWAFQSMQTRFVIWEVVFKMIHIKPLFGYGPDVLVETFQRYLDPNIFYFERFNSFVDRAHNEILQLLVDQGVFGLIGYLGTFFVGIWIGLKKSKDSLMLASVCSLIGLFAANMFGFSLELNFLLWWIILAILVSSSDIFYIRFEIRKVFRVILAFICVLFSAFSIYMFSYKPLAADYYFSTGNFEKAIRFAPYESYYYFQAVQSFLDINDSRGAGIFLDRAYDHSMGKMSDYLFYRARWLIYENRYDEALIYFQKVYEQAPYMQNNLLEWARLLSKMNKYNEALEKYNLYFDMVPFWKWIDQIENRDSRDKSNFRLFFLQNPDVLGIFDEASIVASLASNKNKSEFYLEELKKIKKFLKLK